MSGGVSRHGDVSGCRVVYLDMGMLVDVGWCI